ncbi:MAG: permease [Thermoleophilia bacterium]
MLLAAKPPARGLARLPLWLRVAAPLIALAVFYHYWLPLSSWLNHDLLHLGTDRLGAALTFFIYEVPKVFMLLIAVVFAVGVVRSFFSPERTRALLAGRREFVGNVMAAALGIATPFCSCSAVPLFIGFVEVGVPLGVTFSFLIAAPMINEVAVVLLFGLFGWKVAALYISTGLFIAIFAGWVVGHLKLERFIEDWVRELRAGETVVSEQKLNWHGRVVYALQAERDIVGKVWPYVVAGIAVGAGIHGYVPTNFMARFMGKGAWWGVPLAVILGVPMYSNAAGVIPIVQALLQKGAALGTVLAFMMAVVGLSLPETIILRKVLKWPLIAAFVGTVTVGILIVGFLFNLVL